MKYLDEYREPQGVARFADKIAHITTRPWTIMEVCGGQTHAIVRYGIDRLLPDSITLLHGPGCPVCVTPVELIDTAVHIASQPGVIFCSFGDMLRVPGTGSDLQSVKAAGGDVRMVYSPLDALAIAQSNPEREVVFFAIGFETTAPANAATVQQAQALGVTNFSILVAQVLVPPAIEAILAAPGCNVQGFLAAGHVCTIMGYSEYERLARRYQVPIVVTGFEPLDILEGICRTVAQLEAGKAEVENQYRRAVKREGNLEARKMMIEVFAVIDRSWRGLGVIADSGFRLRRRYESFDAVRRFDVPPQDGEVSTECISGLILQGIKKPPECAAYGKQCTPEHPLGATMVSSEGACAAYYRYRIDPNRAVVVS